jgi:hypothetical protein
MQLPAIIPALDTNIIVIITLVGMGLYGLIAGKQSLRILILSIYVGIVLAEQMAPVIRPLLHMLSAAQISWLLLGLPIVVFGIMGGNFKKGEKGVAIANILVGMLAGGLIISSALHLMPTSDMAATDDASFVAMILQQYHLWLLGLLPIVALILGLIRKREKTH